MGYFKVTLHVGITFRARSSLKRYPNHPSPHQMLARKHISLINNYWLRDFLKDCTSFFLCFCTFQIIACKMTWHVANEFLCSIMNMQAIDKYLGIVIFHLFYSIVTNT
jgi:hypothetical protein